MERSRRWSSARSARGANASSPRRAWLGAIAGPERPGGREKHSPPPFSPTMKAWGVLGVLWARKPAGLDLILDHHELQDTLSAATIALEISGPRARVAALQKRWDRLRAGLD